MSEQLISRREALKNMAALGGGFFAAIYAPRVLGYVNAMPSISEEPISATTGTETAIPSPTNTQTPTPETPTPEMWNLSLPERVRIMAMPSLFTELQGKNTKKIITLQFDENEYAGMKRELTHYNNTCGAATLTTLKKMLMFLDTGKVPEITISDIDTVLDGKLYTNKWNQEFKYVERNELMPVEGLPSAINLLMPQLVSKVEYFTRPSFWSPETKSMLLGLILRKDWPYYMSKAQTVCENGGCAIVVGKKHNYTHIMLATDVNKDGTATFIDSYTGIAKRSSLNDIFQQVNGQPAFVALIGITGKLNTSN